MGGSDGVLPAIWTRIFGRCFFSVDVVRFDKTGLPVFKDMTIEEAFKQFDERS